MEKYEFNGTFLDKRGRETTEQEWFDRYKNHDCNEYAANTERVELTKEEKQLFNPAWRLVYQIGII